MVAWRLLGTLGAGVAEGAVGFVFAVEFAELHV